MNIMLISGGSGGHLVPAMALAEHLQPEDQCLLVSTRRPVDQILSADHPASFQWETVGLQLFTPVWRWFLPPYVACQISAVRHLCSLIGRSKPDVVVGFGGYLSAVGVVAARSAGIPAVIHEQNFIPGRANRLLARLADAVAVSFPETRRYLPRRAAVETTGNPHRLRSGSITQSQARAELGLDPERPVLLIMGGSQGSQAINRLSLQMWETVPVSQRQAVQALHLAGPAGVAGTEQSYRKLGMQAVVFPFLRRMDWALASATLAVSRAGATGIAEMVAMAVPSLLIPYPYAGAHQLANAQWARGIGGAVILQEAVLTPEKLGLEVNALLSDPARLARMQEALRAQSDGAAAQRLGELVRRVAKTRPIRSERAEARTADMKPVHPSTGLE